MESNTGLGWQFIADAERGPSYYALVEGGRYSATVNPYEYEAEENAWTAWYKAKGASSWDFLGFAADEAGAKALCEKAENPGTFTPDALAGCGCESVSCEKDRRHVSGKCSRPAGHATRVYGLRVNLCRVCLDAALRRSVPVEVFS